MTTRPNKKNVSIQQVITALLDNQTIFPPVYLHHFSDLEGADLDALRTAWPQVNAERRFHLLEDLEDLAELDTLVMFDTIARFALSDPDPRVRTVALRMLWESEDDDLASIFTRMLREDADMNVRAAAASALGKFIYLGELEEISEDLLHQVEASLLEVMNSNEPTTVRRHALEALGFSSRGEVPEMIRTAYKTGEPDWLASALFAMGRSADQSWGPDVLNMLDHPLANVQLEAIRAAGELSLAAARRPLLRILLEEETEEGNLRYATIWSLSQIGGEDVRDTLEELLEETEDEDEAEYLEDALDNLSFTEDMSLFELMDIQESGEGEELDVDSLAIMDDEDEDEFELLEDEDVDDSPKPKTDETKSKEKNRKRHRRSS